MNLEASSKDMSRYIKSFFGTINKNPLDFKGEHEYIKCLKDYNLKEKSIVQNIS